MSALSKEDISALKTIEEKWPRYSLGADWGKLTALLTDDIVFMPPDEPAVEGKAAVKAWLEKFPPVTAQTVSVVHVEGGDTGA
jgi:ketosteroid isomerase-like protein